MFCYGVGNFPACQDSDTALIISHGEWSKRPGNAREFGRSSVMLSRVSWYANTGGYRISHMVLRMDHTPLHFRGI